MTKIELGTSLLAAHTVDRVLRVRIDRAAKRNAMTQEMYRGLKRAAVLADADPELDALCITGTDDVFASGGDMSGHSEDPEGLAHELDPTEQFPFRHLERCRKLVVAAVNGHAIGLGMTLVMQCDLRFFAREGKYGIVQVRRGVLGDAYSHWTVVRAVGLARAAELLLTGKTFDGDEIERLGVASRMLPAAQVLPAALDIARDVAVNAAPVSVAASKRLLWQAAELSAEEVERRETELHLKLMPKPDAIEGPLAFAEKRRPRWKLRVSKDWPA